MKKPGIKFWLSCKWDAVRSFLLLIKRLPGFYRLNRFWDADPQFYTDVIRDYSEVMRDLTGGRLRKPSHDAQTVIEQAWNYLDGYYAALMKEWKEESKESTQDKAKEEAK